MGSEDRLEDPVLQPPGVELRSKVSPPAKARPDRNAYRRVPASPSARAMDCGFNPPQLLLTSPDQGSCRTAANRASGSQRMNGRRSKVPAISVSCRRSRPIMAMDVVDLIGLSVTHAGAPTVYLRLRQVAPPARDRHRLFGQVLSKIPPEPVRASAAVHVDCKPGIPRMKSWRGAPFRSVGEQLAVHSPPCHRPEVDRMNGSVGPG